MLDEQALSEWMQANPDAIQLKSPAVNQILTVFCNTSMLVAGTLGFLLDNTIPGTNLISFIFNNIWRKLNLQPKKKVRKKNRIYQVNKLTTTN